MNNMNSSSMHDFSQVEQGNAMCNQQQQKGMQPSSSMVFKFPNASSNINFAMQSTQADSADLQVAQRKTTDAISASAFDTPRLPYEKSEERSVEQLDATQGSQATDQLEKPVSLTDDNVTSPLHSDLQHDSTDESNDVKRCNKSSSNVSKFIKLLFSRTDLCKHKGSCAKNTASGMLQTLINMYGVKLFVNNMFYIANPKKLLSNLMSVKSQKDNVRFAVFMALMNGVYKFALCIFRRVFKKDEIASPIAGFLAGLCCILDAKNRRKFLMIMLLARVCDTAYTMGESRGLYTSYKYGALFVWAVANIVQMYAMAFEQDCMFDGQRRFMEKWSQLTAKDTQYQSVLASWNRATSDRVVGRLLSAQPLKLH